MSVTPLGWALVHFLWEGALIALVPAVILPVFRDPRARYGAACVALLAMPAAFALTFALSIPEQGAAVAAPIGSPVAMGMADGAPGVAARIQDSLPWVVGFWMTGALLIGLYRLGGWVAVERLRRTLVRAAPPEWRERLARLARRIGVSRSVELLESSLAETPVVIGFLRPVILLPAGLLTGLPAEHIEAILLHELAHIRRSDYLLNLVQTLLESLLFYHPAVWWVSGLMRAERENCCDDAVVAVQGDARGYAAALLTLEEQRGARRRPALAATGGTLMNRIRRLLHQPQEPRSAAGLILSMALLLSLFGLLAAAQQSRPAGQAEGRTEAREQAQKGPETSYNKWLTEEVVYIIEDRERDAFERLQADAERRRFIEQFWLRRDPNPATPGNEFKQEHYRRIEVANTRFAATAPGWKTDRGRIYIVHGPPDEIDNRPGVQRWNYRRADGVGEELTAEFVDPKHSGEFRLRAAPAEK